MSKHARTHSLNRLVEGEPAVSRRRVHDPDYLRQVHMTGILDYAKAGGYAKRYEPGLLSVIRDFIQPSVIAAVGTKDGRGCLFNKNPAYEQYCQDNLGKWINALLSQKLVSVQPEGLHPAKVIRWQLQTRDLSIVSDNGVITSELEQSGTGPLYMPWFKRITNQEAQQYLRRALAPGVDSYVIFRITVEQPKLIRNRWTDRQAPTRLTIMTARDVQVLPLIKGTLHLYVDDRTIMDVSIVLKDGRQFGSLP